MQVDYTNRTNTVVFHRDVDKELKRLLKGDCEPGHVCYTFGTLQAAAKWLKTPAAKREMKKSQEVMWRTRDGSGDFIGHGVYAMWCDQGREELAEDVEKCLASEEDRRLDEAYLDHWKKIAEGR